MNDELCIYERYRYVTYSALCVAVLTIAQLPGNVVLLASAVLEKAQRGGGVPGVVWVSVESVEPQDQVQTSTIGKVVQFV